MNSRSSVLSMAAAALAILACVEATRAGTFTYFGEDAGQGEFVRLASHPNADAARNSFFAQLIGVGTENFEGFAVNTESPLAVTFGSDTATLSGGGNIASVSTGTNGVGRYPISGNQYWETSSVLQLDFTAPQAAFGFYGVDIGDFDGQLTLSLIDGGTTTLTVPNTIAGAGGSVLYYGVISTVPFTSVQFGNTQVGVDYFGFDDFSIGRREQVIIPPEGAVVPLPATALVSIGMLSMLGAVGILRRRIGR